MAMKSLLWWKHGLLAVILAGSMSVAVGDTIASKIEQLGEMKFLVVDDLRVVKRNGLLHVQATFVNTDNENRQLYYRVKWFDADGLMAWDDEAWKTITLYGAQRQNLLFVAPTPKATDFKIEVQTPENVVK
jgi:uncharacterized protein YcfL